MEHIKDLRKEYSRQWNKGLNPPLPSINFLKMAFCGTEAIAEWVGNLSCIGLTLVWSPIPNLILWASSKLIAESRARCNSLTLLALEQKSETNKRKTFCVVYLHLFATITFSKLYLNLIRHMRQFPNPLLRYFILWISPRQSQCVHIVKYLEEEKKL